MDQFQMLADLKIIHFFTTSLDVHSVFRKHLLEDGFDMFKSTLFRILDNSRISARV